VGPGWGRASEPAQPGVGGAGSNPGPGLEIRCFGAFSIARNGRAIDLGGLKPRSRTLLHFLALHAAGAVHREVIQEALWPDADQSTAARSLQVGISTLRGLIEPRAGRGGAQLILREGEGYRLALDEGSFVDVRSFKTAVDEARVSQSRGDAETAMASLRRAVELHRGELLAEDGPAEWVVDRREAFRSQAAEAATSLAGLLLAGGDPEGATRACRAGLAIDRYHDPLWRLLIESRERAGDSGAAIRARQEYEVVLSNLGVATRSAARGDLEVGVR
jgi:DNA-binding SARP family transcriptional activator